MGNSLPASYTVNQIPYLEQAFQTVDLYHICEGYHSMHDHSTPYRYEGWMLSSNAVLTCSDYLLRLLRHQRYLPQFQAHFAPLVFLLGKGHSQYDGEGPNDDSREKV